MLNLPEHGGDLAWAERTFKRNKENWLDLSTGISPWVYPLAKLPESIIRNLPYDNKPTINAAASYYQCSTDKINPIPGSQWLIETLPTKLKLGAVALPIYGYSEHLKAWKRANHQIFFYQSITELQNLIASKCCYAVVINPNNPTTESFSKEALVKIEESLAHHHKNDALLVVDEAFLDTSKEISFASYARSNQYVVLRSIGKFFGLAGLRLGFALCAPLFARRLGLGQALWQVNHPALFWAEAALKDECWIANQKIRLEQQSIELQTMLTDRFNQHKVKSTPLFSSVFGTKIQLYNEFIRLAQLGVLTRFFDYDHIGVLRFGLPGEQFKRLSEIL